MVYGFEDDVGGGLVEAVDQIFCTYFAVHGAGDEKRRAEVNVLCFHVSFESVEEK